MRERATTAGRRTLADARRGGAIAVTHSGVFSRRSLVLHAGDTPAACSSPRGHDGGGRGRRKDIDARERNAETAEIAEKIESFHVHVVSAFRRTARTSG